MKLKTAIQKKCNQCQATDIKYIGKLKDNVSFAGKTYEIPLPGGHLYQCNLCHLKFRSPLLENKKYTELYNNGVNTNWQSTSTRNDWLIISNFIESNLMKGSKILDFGCNTGELLRLLDLRYQKFGVEVNHSAAAIAETQARAIIYESIEAIPNPSKFDVIILCDVIEHLANPAEILFRLAEYLEPKGVILMTTGDANCTLWKTFGANWWYCSFAEHISFISESWVNEFVKVAPFTKYVIESFKYSNLSPLAYLINFFAMIFFGLLPNPYIKLTNWLMNVLGKSGDAPIKGQSLSRDHIFIVLETFQET